MVSIKPSRADDQKWAAQMMSTSEPWITLGIGYDQCLNVCSDPEFETFISFQSEQPTGVLVLDPRGLAGAPYVKVLAIASVARGKGWGNRLLDFAEGHFRKQSKHLFLCVSSFNTNAQSFYQKNGYVQVAELKDHIRAGASEFLYSKVLG